MKNLITKIVLITTVLVAFSCRKGEDDPLLSLLSRRARVTGEWKMTAYQYKSLYYIDAATYINDSQISDGQTIRLIREDYYPQGSIIEDTIEKYSVSYEFEKNGKYKIVETRDDFSRIDEGSWNFVGKNKGKDLKNKEAIMLVLLHREESIPSQVGNQL